MACQDNLKTISGGDRLELGEISRPFDLSATAWLIGQGLTYLNVEGKEGELAYKRIIELLSCNKAATGTLTEIYQKTDKTDVSLRWCLLYLLGDVGDESAINFLAKTITEKLPEENEAGCCEGPRDQELLIRTMAAEALIPLGRRYPKDTKKVLSLLRADLAQPVLIEVVKAANALGMKDKVKEILTKKQKWILDIRKAKHEEIQADSERTNNSPCGFAPPHTDTLKNSPIIRNQ